MDATMEIEANTRRLVHYYDVEQHRVLCGVREQIGSTKHTSAVTCPDCLRLLADNAPPVGVTPADVSA